MTLGFNHYIAPKPTTVLVQSQSVANALSIMASLPREGGDERHIGINEWVDRVRLSLTDEKLYRVALVMWGVGIEGLLNVIENPDAHDNFELFLDELEHVPAETLRDSCLYWMVNSVHWSVFVEAPSFSVVSIDDLLADRKQFIAHLHQKIAKDNLQQYFEAIADLYFAPSQLKQLTISVLQDLWQDHFKAEWARHQHEIAQVVEAFLLVDTSSMAAFDALQVITGRDLRPVFRADILPTFERIICVPSKHNGPYVMWFGNQSTLYIIFTARMPSGALLVGQSEPDLNVLIQRFKALSDDNRMQVLLAIRDQGELSTQDIIEQFDLNKSAVSRYLGQLFANGFIQERRDTDGKTKYYSINNDMVDSFLQSIAHILKK